jgi:hypothetical protein
MATSSAALAQRRDLGREPLPPGADGYVRLVKWRRDHVPWLLEPGGPAIFFRLITASEAIPTTALFRNAGGSSPKLRKILYELRRLGLVTVVANEKDRRREMVEATYLFRRLARCYARTMVEFIGASG